MAALRRGPRLAGPWADRTPGQPRRVTVHHTFPSLEAVPYATVAETPPQLVARCRALIGARMRYLIVRYGHDEETLRLLAEAVMPHLTTPQAGEVIPGAAPS
jgi:hypothetical protein